ncbi:uncharacterized protein [Antedon mediterranea]|uniref:uncharacterized protein n=1 Tax=Antedon mediterranea TaxID=105859 RepID=UPI003AF494AC
MVHSAGILTNSYDWNLDRNAVSSKSCIVIVTLSRQGNCIQLYQSGSGQDQFQGATWLMAFIIFSLNQSHAVQTFVQFVISDQSNSFNLEIVSSEVKNDRCFSGNVGKGYQ